MSEAILSKCWLVQIPKERGIARGVVKSVLISLANDSNDNGICTVSIDAICWATCFERDAVMRAISYLEEIGLLIVYKDNGKTSTYQLLIDTSSHRQLVGQSYKGVL